jgi:hypothetical protein
MMTLRRLLPIGLLIGALSGCSSTRPADGAIDYRVSGGLSGQGDGTAALHVEMDGTVTRTRPGGGSETATLTPAARDALYQKVTDADFASLAATYDCACADDVVQVVTAHVGGVAHTVEAHMLGDVPGELRSVIDALHAIAGSSLDWH